MRLAVLLLVPALAAQPPGLRNARLETRSAAAGLDSTLRAILSAEAGPAWAAYAIPAVPGQHSLCCSGPDSCAACALEGGAPPPAAAPAAGPVYLEGPPHVFVFYRILDHQVERIRVFSPECAIDAGAVPFVWLTDVKPAESIAWLVSLSRAGRRPESAVMAIALHAAPPAIPTLNDMAHRGTSPRERSRALFWLALAAPADVARRAIDDAIAHDPASDVKRQAVFALSRIPHNEGVPRLIELARSGTDAAVRKQAMFWLARVKDARADRFFADVLR